MSSSDLPQRELLMPYRESERIFINMSSATMRKIADDFQIKGLRRESYYLLMRACHKYMIDGWIERDVRGINEARALYCRGLSVARKCRMYCAR